jgi:glycosyltransferase involved in cell wall biosynthesis
MPRSGMLAPPRNEGPPQRGAPRPLRIAMIAPPWFAVPPPAYGGIEAMVADLVDGLVARGHDVTLIAAGSPGTPAQRSIATYPDPPSRRLGDPMPEVLHAATAACALDGMEVDVVHDHTLAGPLLARGRRVPTVVTAHGPVTGEPGDYLARLGTTIDLVAISEAQRRLRPEINWLATIHHGIDVASYPLGSGGGDHLRFIGRFTPDKGAHLAIDAARRAGRRIVVAGKCNEPAEHAYFDQAIAPRLGPDVQYVGEADAATKRELYAGATALLFPVQWEEPFGLVMVEAMACGTPVVALNRGSVPEIVCHGVTGEIVDDPADLPDAVERAESLDRRRCRAHVQNRFDLPRMVVAYEAAYRTVVDGIALRVAARPDDPSLTRA